MMKKVYVGILNFKRILFLLALLFISVINYAQEVNCGDGIDNDGDGLIDCFDSDCYGSAVCDLPLAECNSVGDPVNSEFATRTQCSYLDGTFYIGTQWRNFNPSGYDTPKSGDVDHDGKVDLIVVSDGGDEGIYIFDPTICEPKYYIPCTMSENHGGVSFANVDSDSSAEIFISTGNDNGNADANTLRRYDFNELTHTWSLTWFKTNYNKRGFPPDIIDFNGDGTPELITYGWVNRTIPLPPLKQIQILSVDGAILVDFATNTTLMNRVYWKDVYAYADVIPTGFDPDGAGPKTALLYANGPEVILGNRVFTVDIATGNFEDVYGVDPLTSTGAASNHSPWVNGMGDGDAGQKVSIADVNFDGNVDVVVTGQGYMTVWNPLTNRCLYPRYNLAGGGGTGKGGAVCVGDIDGDASNRPELGIVSVRQVEIARVNSAGTALEKVWSLATTDASGETAMNFFDFEGDGKAELVYRDQDTIKVYVGSGNGAGQSKVLFQDPYSCRSGTGGEHPIIADIDGDNRAEIIASCQEGIRIYRDNKTPWISARSVFNQRAYNYTNINDDLSVPANPQLNHKVPYLNNYLSQLYLIDKTGNPYFPAPDFTVELENVTTDVDLTSSCPTSVKVRLKVCNGGDALADYSIPISFYQNDPRQAGAKFIQRTVVTLSLDANECGKTDPIDVPLSDLYNGNGNNDGILYFYVNDDGDGMIPNKVLTAGVNLPNSPYSECDYTNNLYGPINIVDCKFAPTIFGPSSDTQNEDAVLQFKASNGNVISIKDDDGDNQTVTISLSNSTFSLSGTTGLTFAIGDGSNDVSMTFSGTLANINAALLNSFITPNANYNGSYNMQITTNDGSGSIVAKTIALTFNAVNDLPVLDDVDLSGYDDDILPIILADFENQWQDSDNDPISMVKILSLPTNGYVKLNGVPVVVNQEILAAELATLTFEPNLNWSGVTFFRYNASDGMAYASVSKKVNLTVLSQNDAPILSDVLITTPLNTTLTFAASNFTINYYDVDGNPMSDIKIPSLPLNGILEHNGTPISEFYEIPASQIAQLTYIPNTGFAAIDSFQWNASDGTLDAISNMWVKVHVGAPNSAPTLTNFASSTTEDGVIAFSSTDFVSHYSDAESNPLDRIRITSLPTNGALTLGATPLNVFDEVVASSLDQITFTPDANWYGTNSFSWKATDGILYSSTASTVTITISSVNDEPVVNDISKTGVENGTTTFTAANFTSSFSDTEGSTLAKIMVVTLPANGVLKLSGVDIIAGQEIVTAQLGNITFVPTPGWSGVSDFTWNGSDGTSYAASGSLVTFSYTNVNTAPLLSALEGSTLSYTENAVPFYITSAIVVSDDASVIESATVSITANFKLGEDYLKFTNTASIIGTYDAVLGILTLRGVDTKANYQDALRAVQYFNLSDAPSSSTRTITFSVTDGSLLSNIVSRQISVVPVNDLPAFSNIESVGWFPNENVPTNISATATIEDLDDLNLESAVAKFSINYQNGQDILSFVNANGIVGNWNAATGTLTLTGSSSVANYQAAIRSIKYTNTSDAPNVIMRTVNIYVNDGDGNSNLQFITITPVPVPDAPILANMEAAPWAYLEADGANVVLSLTSASVTVTDPENSRAIGGAIKISGNYQFNQDVLSWNTASGIVGSFDPLTGVLTLTGTTTLVNYQAALRASLRYTNTSDVPNTSIRTISITLADSSGNSNTITRNLTVASTNDTPTLTAINKSGLVSSTIAFTLADFTSHFIDRDGNALTKIQIKTLPTNGILYLDADGDNVVDAGEAIVINTDIDVATLALGRFKFNTDATARIRTFTWQGNDGTVFSANGTATIVWNGNSAPVVSNFTKTGPENVDITFAVANFTYADAESNPMINVQILTLPANGVLYRDADGDGIVDAGESIVQGGVVAATGAPIPLSQLKFKPTTNWNGSTTFSWIAQDDNGANDKWSNTPANCNITITAVNSAPATLPFAVTLIEDNIYTFSAGQFAYTDPEANAFTQIQISTAVTAGTLFRDADSDNVIDAGETLVLNSTVAVANLNQIKFKPALNGAGTPYATFQYRVYDGTTYSASVVVTINVTPAQEAPVLGAVEVAPLIYTEDDPATSVSSTLTIADVDNNFMSSATVQITGGYVNGEDYLTFSNTPYISGVWNATTGTMTLSGLYLASSYQEALRNVKYANSSNEPNLGARTVTFMANDGMVNSVAGTRTINIVPVNDPPFLSNVEVTDLLFTENDPAISLTSAILMIDYDDTNIESAQVAVSTNYYNGQDVLSFVNTPNITGSWNATTGVITLSGTDTEANYIAAIKTVKYINLSENPNDLPKKISFTMNDGIGTSIPVTRTINIAKINDTPTAANSSVSTNEDVMKVFAAANFNYYDLDMNALFRVKITSLETAGTLFLDANVNNIVDAGEDIVVGQEISSPSLNKLKFKPIANTVGSPYTTFEFMVSDGTIFSIGSYTMTINVLPLNDAPTSADFGFTILEDIVRTITTAEIAYNDIESDPFNKLKIVSSPSRGTLFNDANLNGVIDAGETLATNSEILRSAIDNNQFKYKPVLNGNGANYSVFQYRVSDGTSYSATSNRVTINVTAVNDAPTGTNGSLTANEGVAKAIAIANFGFADVDGNSCTKVNFPALPTAGTLFVDANSNGAVDAGEAVVAGADVVIATINAGQLKFLNALNGYGSPYSTISFKVSDGTLYSVATNTITVNVTQMPDVTLSVSAGIINETGSTASTVTATLNVATVNNVVVSLGFAGTAVGGGSDYTASSNSITIIAGSTTGSITITAVDDNIYETATNETAIVSISTVTNGRESGVQTQTIDIVDNEPLPTITLALNSATIAEATSQTCIFTATSNRASSQAITVNLILSGTASVTDYTSSGTTITIAAGATTGSVSVTAVNDNLIDPAETVVADISSVTNATENGTQQVTTTITDNDVAGFTITPSGGSTSTNESGTTDNFTVVLTAQPYSNVVLSVTSGDVTEGSVSPVSLTYTPLNWNTAQSVTVTGLNDFIIDGTITYNVVIGVVDASSDDNFDSLIDQNVSVTNLDNDNAGFVITQSGGTTATSETATADNFTVVLMAQPTTDVVLSVTSADLTEGTVSPTSLTFTNANWNTAQTVTVTGVDDNIIDGTINYNISVSVVDASSDNSFDPLVDQTVSVANADNDVAGFTITQSGGSTSTSETGTADDFTVVLNVQPNSNVIINIANGDATEGSISTPTLTFTTANWNVAQTVTVTGVDDALIDGSIVYSATLSIVDASSDNNFDPLADQTVTITNIDNDTPGFTISQSGGTTSTNESATTDVISVVLNAQPNSNVVIDVTGLDATEGSLSSSSLTFTPANWNTTQNITVIGVDDAIIDGTISYTLTFAINDGSSDNNFDLLADQTASVSNVDNDIPAFTIVQTGGTTATSEAGTTDNFTVVLGAQPASNVVLNITGVDATEGTLSTTALTFTTGNWNVAQTVSITGVNDFIIDGPLTYSLTMSVDDLLSDNNFDPLADQTISVTNSDNDVAGFTITQSGGTTTTSETGTTDNFAVVLTAQPISDVVINISNGDATEGTISTSALTFTSANWNITQSVTVTSVDDNIIDGTVNYSLTLSINDLLSDNNFDPLIDQTVSVSNSDNDVAGFTVTQSGGTTSTSEIGTTDNFTVLLTAQPNSNVVISVTSADVTEGTLSATNLTFTSANWNVAQTVTVTSVDDNLVDGTINYNITLSVVDVSSDNNFDPLVDQLVTASNTDNDVAGFIVSQSGGSTSTSETLSTDNFTVILTAQPNSNVVISVAGLDATEGSLSSASFSFTPANWNVAQTITVTGVDDFVMDGDITYNLTVGVVDASSDNNFDLLVDQTIAVTNTDNDVAGFTVTQSGGVSATNETGSTDNFTVVLTSQPTSNVVISITSADVSEGTVAPASLTFTTTNWNVAQSVTITGVNDFIIDGSITYNVTLSVVDASSDNVFDSIVDQTVAITNADNDVAGFTITQSGGATTTGETLTTDNFTVVLNAQPNSNVIISVSGIDATEGSISATPLTFTPANWNVSQTVTLTGINDFIIDGDITYLLTLAVVDASSDDNFDTLADQSVAVTNTDNDMAGFTVTPSGGSTLTSELGSTDNFTVVLTAQPATNVEISVASADNSEGSVLPVTLIFTPANWNVAQTATVTGLDDNIIDGSVTFNVVLSVIDANSDDNFDLLGDQNISVSNSDNDVAGFAITQTGGATITDEGATVDNFSVVLSAQPNSNVQLTISGVDPTEGTANVATLTFTPADWNTAQTVIITGVDDNIIDGTINYTVTVSVLDASSDNNFDTLADQTVSVSNSDNDVAGISIVQTGGFTQTDEALTTDNLTVVLTAQPASNVVVNVISADVTEGTTSPASFTFTPANWNVAQNVTVTGVNDFIIDGTVNYSVSVSVNAALSDDNFDLIPVQNVSASNTDDDLAGFTLSKVSALVSETGTTDLFTVLLTAQPNSNVVINITNSNATECSISNASITFTPANWNIAQTVTITGVDDLVADGSQTFNLTLSVNDATSDNAFDAIADQAVAVTNADNDTPGISLSSISGNTSEAGTTVTFSIVLNTMPTADVIIPISSSNSAEGSLAGVTSIVFTTANWNLAQFVTITGVDDDIIDGTINYSIITAASSSTDSNYNGINTTDVALQNNDNDVASFTLSTIALSVSEAGSSDNFTMVLGAKPTSNVVFTILNSNSTEVALSSSTITFDALNWNIPQTVALIGENDLIVDGNQTVTISVAVDPGLSDDSFDAMVAQIVTVTNIDNDLAGFNLSKLTLNTSETDGVTDDFDVTLSAQPLADVIIDVVNGNSGEISTDKSQLTFTSANWNTPQTVTVSGVDDLLADGNKSVVLTLRINDAFSDNAFDNLNDQLVTVLNADNDVADVTVSLISNNTSESATTATFTVQLNTQPTDAVTLSFASLDLTEGAISSMPLVFDASNWSTPQVVTITGVDDNIIDGSISYTISGGISTSLDLNYNSIDVDDVTITNDDNDFPSFVVVASGGSNQTSENLISDSFTIALSAQPTFDVVVNIISADITEGVSTTTQLTFNSTNWNTPQSVLFVGVDDNIIDGVVAFGIELRVDDALSDDSFDGLVTTVSAQNLDNDAASFNLSKLSATTSESGATDNFTVVLSSEPLSNVIFNLVNSNPLEGTVSETQLTFTSVNWNIPQNVTITGVDDLVDDGDQLYTLSISVDTSSDPDFMALPAQVLNLLNVDDDASGVIVTSVANNTTETGVTSGFTIVLLSEPTADVQIDLTCDDPSEGVITPSSLIFTSANWNQVQTITITGVDDNLLDGNVAFNVITANAQSTDLVYNGFVVDDVSVVNEDDDVANFVLSKLNATTTEKGGSDSFDVVLPFAPLSNVVLNIVSDNVSEGVVNVSQITFTPLNWNTPQTITITGQNDLLPDGSITYSVLVSVDVALSDASFSSIPSQAVAVINSDDDSAGITISPLSNSTSESGTTATFTVVLNSPPTADVSMELSSSNINEGVVSMSQITFTSLNWNVAQTITVTGVDDAVIDGNVIYTIFTSDIVSTDLNYNGIVVADLDALNLDNDVNPDFVVSKSTLSTTESGVSDNFDVVLTQVPAADVVIDILSSNLVEGTVSPIQITFTSLNWNTPQTVTVTGVDDSVVDDNQTYNITISVNDGLSDANYSSVSDQTIVATNIDNDQSLAGITISQASGITSEDGITSSFTLILGSQPNADVIIPLSSSNTSEGTIGLSEVIFTPLNWNQVQTVTITGVDDVVIDGSVIYYIVTGAAVSTDLQYNGIDVTDVEVVNVDNDFDNAFPDANDIVVSDVVEAPTVIDVLAVATGLGDGGIVVSIETQPSHGTSVVNADSTITYTPEVNYKGDDSFTYTICDWNGDCSTATISLIVDTDTSFYIPDGFSPNGDGVNDYFVIPNLYKYSDVSLEVFNRWGNVVYRSTSYQNDWNGFSNVDLTIGSELPIGAYFYIVTIKELGKSFSGDVYLGR